MAYYDFKKKPALTTKEGEKDVLYPSIVFNGTINTKQLLKQLVARTGYKPGVVEGTLMELVDLVGEYIGQGYRVEVGEFGYFSGKIKSRLVKDKKDIEELSEIVKMGIVFENNEYALISESAFHTKLYKITGNKIISEFQEIIHPILVYVKEKFKDYLKPINIEMSKSGKIATHADLLDFIKKGDEKGYRDAIERHFEVYKIFKVNRSQELMAEKESSEKVEGI
jgi:predicted histone-like DNA-binding protein